MGGARTGSKRFRPDPSYPLFSVSRSASKCRVGSRSIDALLLDLTSACPPANHWSVRALPVVDGVGTRTHSRANTASRNNTAAITALVRCSATLAGKVIDYPRLENASA